MHDHRGNKNPKWRGGVSFVKTADNILDLDKQVRDRLFANLLGNYEKSGTCWNWTGTLFNKRYGRFSAGKCGLSAHKVSFVLHTGTKAGNGFVCHTCDNPQCINPEHLYLGSAATNAEDRRDRGRQQDQRGSKNPYAKLTEKQVQQIKAALRAKVRQNRLAIQYRVSKSTINLIALGRIWTQIS